MGKKQKPKMFEEYWQAIGYCSRNSIKDYKVVKSSAKPSKYSKSWEGWHIQLKNSKLLTAN